MLVTQNDIDSFTSQNGVLNIQGSVAVVGSKYEKNWQIRYSTTLRDWIVNGVKLVDGDVEFSREAGTNNFRLTYPHEYSDLGLGIVVDGAMKIYYINQLDIDAVNNGNAKLYVNDVLATNTTPVKNGDVLKVVADSGFQFFLNSRGKSSVRTRNNFYVPLADDKLSGQFVVGSVVDRFLFSVETIAITPDEIAGVNNVYKLDAEKVKTIISTKWIDDTAPLKPVEIGNEIISVLEFPFPIPSKMIGGLDGIRLGSYNTQVQANVLNDDQIIVNIGAITIPDVKNNFLDYKETTAILNLPYVEPLFLEKEDVIGKTITIEYVINLYNSMNTINVKSDGRLIVSKTVDMNLQIPFGNVQKVPKGSNPNEVSIVKKNFIKTAYIEVVRNNTILENGLFTIPIIDENLIGENVGYIEIEKLEFKGVVNSDDKEMILTVLRKGVIIK